MDKKYVQVTINTGENTATLQAPRGRHLKGLLGDAKIGVVMPCGGTGRCGKCKVRFLKGAPRATSLDNHFLTEKEIEEGVRLLCRCVLTEDAEIVVDDKNHNEEDIVAPGKAPKIKGKVNPPVETIRRWGVAIDIGTTTIGAMLLGLDSENDHFIYELTSGINHQRSYGADVISRIAAASEGAGLKLQNAIRDDITKLLKDVTDKHGVSRLDVIAITANTTMLHLLRGYDVSGLGVYPYKPVKLGTERISALDLLGRTNMSLLKADLSDTKVLIMPGISAFVGADIVSDIYADSLVSRDESTLLIDLGTNGEMAFWDGKKLYVTSTAAGPVFEAGGIKNGVAAIPGAIEGVYLAKSKTTGELEVKLDTVKGKEAIGICGAGALDAVAELVRCKIVDETGLLTDEYFEEGFPLTKTEPKIRITQSDIRNVQLGKAAIYAAQKELLKGKKPDHIVVCGGYGGILDSAKIKYLKLFPYKEARVSSMPGEALIGCMELTKAALRGQEDEDKVIAELERIAGMAQVVELLNKDDFAENYVEAMNF